MQGLSLSDVINEMAAGRIKAATLSPRAPANQSAPAEPLDELGAFMQMDDLLAHLNKRYLQARRQHTAARREHGADSPMADIALDLEDSAWCAMQTRYMELRADGALMRCAQRMMRESEEDFAREAQAEKDRRALAFFNRMELARQLERNKTPHIFEFIFVLMVVNGAMRLPFARSAAWRNEAVRFAV